MATCKDTLCPLEAVREGRCEPHAVLADEGLREITEPQWSTRRAGDSPQRVLSLEMFTEADVEFERVSWLAVRPIVPRRARASDDGDPGWRDL